VADGSQNAIRRKKVEWSKLGIKAQGRTIHEKIWLNENYRNTYEILSAAWTLLNNEQSVSSTIVENTDEDTLSTTFPIVEPVCSRHGNKPLLLAIDTPENEIEYALKEIKALSKEFQHREIAIFYRNKGEGKTELLNTLIERLSSANLSPVWVTRDETSSRNYQVKVGGVRIITTMSSLGLEFKAVFIIWLDQFHNCCSTNNQAARILARRELYIAMTRAQEKLYLSGSSDSLVLQELVTSGTCDFKHLAPSYFRDLRRNR
jgi:superfamily I DNA/RNA helicase